MTYIKKRGSLTITRPTLRRLSHCPSLLNEQRRSPRRYVYKYIVQLNIRHQIWHIHEHLLLLHSWQRLKFARFRSVKNKAFSKRLIHIWFPFHISRTIEGTAQRYKKYGIIYVLQEYFLWKVQQIFLSQFKRMAYMGIDNDHILCTTLGWAY